MGIRKWLARWKMRSFEFEELNYDTIGRNCYALKSR